MANPSISKLGTQGPKCPCEYLNKKTTIGIVEQHVRREPKGLKEENLNYLSTSSYKLHEHPPFFFFDTCLLKIYFCFDTLVLNILHSCQPTVCVLNNLEQMKCWSRDKKSSKHLSTASAPRAESTVCQELCPSCCTRRLWELLGCLHSQAGSGG